jgi:uncharacterized protein YlxW (UPF0749 family)
MKRVNSWLLCVFLLVGISCRDTKQEQKEVEMDIDKIESVEKEIDETVREVEKKAEEVESALKELDSI